MESEIIKAAVNWGPPAGLLLITLYGSYRLIFWTLTKNAEREKALVAFQQEMVPQMQKLNDSQCAGNAILERIEAKVSACDARVVKKREEVSA